MKNYTDTNKIDRIAQRHLSPSTSSPSQKSNKSMPCSYFNEGTCSCARTHDTKGVTYKHICAACFPMGGKTYPHPEHECRSKNKKRL